MAGDVHAVLATLGIENRPLVVGHSYGGMVATAYAARFPVRGVVNVDQALHVKPTPAHVAETVRGPGFHEFLTSAFTKMYGQLDPAVAKDLSERRRVRQDVMLEVWEPLLDLRPEQLTVFIANLLPARQSTPYLSLHGLPVDDDYASWLSSRIPGAVVETAPVTTHYPHLADPAWFVRRLLAFDGAGPVRRAQGPAAGAPPRTPTA
jgi:pimeloyl-ACP methyl ester carboxylesterase